MFPLPRGKHSRLLHHLLVSNYLNVFAFALFGPLYVLYVSHLGATVIQVSQLLATYAVTLGVFLFIFGWIQNGIRDKRIPIVTGFFWLASGAFAYLLVHGFFSALLVQMWNAVATAWFLPAWKCIYGRGLEQGRETQGWGLVDGGTQILSAVALLLGGMVVARFGFSVLIITVGILQLLSGLYSLIIFRHQAP